ncbi:MAG: C-type lectin domain-containing protein [Lentisphaeria bacterium]|nr:C-type lectin domain-containing protein [Lentisphaeria bacterium]
MTAKHICELLGGSLAILDRREVREHVLQKLSDYKKHRTLLGSYRQGNSWYWLNGSAAEAPLKERIQQGVPTANLNYISYHNNMLFDSQRGCMFLCEWRISSASSH